MSLPAQGPPYHQRHIHPVYGPSIPSTSSVPVFILHGLQVALSAITMERHIAYPPSLWWTHLASWHKPLLLAASPGILPVKYSRTCLCFNICWILDLSIFLTIHTGFNANLATTLSYFWFDCSPFAISFAIGLAAAYENTRKPQKHHPYPSCSITFYPYSHTFSLSAVPESQLFCPPW